MSIVMGLVLEQSLMVITITGIPLCAKVPCYGSVYCYCLHVNYIVYKHYDRSLHVVSSDPTCVQNLRPI